MLLCITTNGHSGLEATSTDYFFRSPAVRHNRYLSLSSFRFSEHLFLLYIFFTQERKHQRTVLYCQDCNFETRYTEQLKYHRIAVHIKERSQYKSSKMK